MRGSAVRQYKNAAEEAQGARYSLTYVLRTFYPDGSVGVPLDLRRRRYGPRRLQGVVEEHRAGHRADAAGHG